MSQPHTTPSPIMMMHQRFEQACAEYDVIDSARTADALKGLHQSAAEHERDTLLKNAGVISNRETDALRIAILHQIPASLTKAMVLQYHIVEAFDLGTGSENQPQAEVDALTTAIETLFDFLCCEVGNAIEPIASAIDMAALRVNRMRLARTGKVEA